MQKIITIILFMGLLVWNPGIMQRVELIGYDYLIMNTEPVQNENILIVDLDEETLKAYGPLLGGALGLLSSTAFSGCAVPPSGAMYGDSFASVLATPGPPLRGALGLVVAADSSA